MKRPVRNACLAVLTLAATISGTHLYGAEDSESLIVRCARPCAAVRAAVAQAGGEITQEYQNIDAIAVRLPRSATASMLRLADHGMVRKDVLVRAPRAGALVDVTRQLAAQGVAGAPIGDAGPADLNYNLALNKVAPLHAAGQIGQDVVIAVIDSGTANVPTIPSLAGRVIGGETFVPASIDPLSATHHENGAHGTMTAQMAAANGAFLFPTSSAMVQSLNQHMPGSAVPCASLTGGCGLPPATAAVTSVVPLTGTAPGAKIYAMKIFAATGGGARGSWILASMDRAITLRRNYNATGANTIASGTGTEDNPFVYSSLKIDVVNMSFAGGTLTPGLDLDDQLTVAMLEVGITPVVSAGNDGFAAMTVMSPGTGLGGLTVGAASTAAHERLAVDLTFGLGVGELYRPTDHIQTAYFSSRGPNADGRNDPDITANGLWSFVHGYQALTPAGDAVDCRDAGVIPGTCAPRLVFVAGTSFSGPTVAGGAALLRRAHPGKNAAQIRNALQQSADPAVLGDRSTSIDQGNGMLDVAAAHHLLKNSRVSSRIPDLDVRMGDDGEDELGAGGSSVLLNLLRAGQKVAHFRNNRYVAQLNNLKPGQVAQIYVPSDAFTSKLTVTIDQITPQLPPAQQNQFFGLDDIYYMIADAQTSSLLELASGFVPHSVTNVIDHPQTGLVRVAVQGDWVNAGEISARVTVTRERNLSLPSAIALIEQDELKFFEFDVPPGAADATFELAWKQNWARTPTNDLDLAIIDPAGNVNELSGGTLKSPERVRFESPMSGRWTVVVVGFAVNGGVAGPPDQRRDIFTIRAEAGGRRLGVVR